MPIPLRKIVGRDAADLLEDAAGVERGARDVVENHEGTDAAKAAQIAIERINSDPNVQGRIKTLVATEEAARWYDLGDRFAKVGLFDLARKQFERVIAEHGDTSVAQKARDRLDKLADEEKKPKEAKESSDQRKTDRAEKKKEADDQAKKTGDTSKAAGGKDKGDKGKGDKGKGDAGKGEGGKGDAGKGEKKKGGG